MKNFFKSKFGTILVLFATIVLAGIAVFTAFRLYKLRQESIAPNAPTSKPAAASVCGPAYGPGSGLIECGTQCCNEATQVCCYNGCKPKSEGCGGSSSTPKPSSTASPSINITQCETLAFTISTATATASPTTTATATASPTTTATATASPTTTATAESTTPQASLPEAGSPLPSILGLGIGGILLIISLFIAL